MATALESQPLHTHVDRKGCEYKLPCPANVPEGLSSSTSRTMQIEAIYLPPDDWLPLELPPPELPPLEEDVYV